MPVVCQMTNTDDLKLGCLFNKHAVDLAREMKDMTRVIKVLMSDDSCIKCAPSIARL